MSVRPSPRRRRHKPAKPSPSFPLTPHNNGQWCKKIRGKLYFFGVWDDPDAAVERYLRVATDLHAGREPRSPTLPADVVTVKQICNHFLTYQHRRSQTGEIGPRWFEDCRTAIESLASFVIIEKERPTDPAVVDRFKAAIKAAADREIGYLNGNAYPVGTPANLRMRARRSRGRDRNSQGRRPHSTRLVITRCRWCSWGEPAGAASD